MGLAQRGLCCYWIHFCYPELAFWILAFSLFTLVHSTFFIATPWSELPATPESSQICVQMPIKASCTTGVDHWADLCCLCHNGQCQHFPHHAAPPPSSSPGATEGRAEGQGSAPQWMPVPWRRAQAGYHREPQIPGLRRQGGAETLYTCVRCLPNSHADIWTWCKWLKCNISQLFKSFNNSLLTSLY